MSLRSVALVNIVCLIIVYFWVIYSAFHAYLNPGQPYLNEASRLAIQMVVSSLVTGPLILFFLLLRKYYK